MHLKHLSLFVIFVILLGAQLTIFETDEAYASGTIYIQENGSISPPTANISSIDEQTYVFTGNINDTIIIQRSNIILDGAGYSLMAPTSERAIYVYQEINVTITNMTIHQSKTGILFEDCSLCSITENLITNNTWHAIELDTSSNNTITGNQIDGNVNRAIMVTGSSNNTIDNNVIINNYRGIEMTYYSLRNSISHNYISHNGVGILLEDYSSQNIILENNIVGNSGHGIAIGTWSGNNTIDGNLLRNNTGTGLAITQSPNCTVVYNEVSGNSFGIHLMLVNTTQLRNNQMFNNQYNFGLSFNEYSDFLNDVDTTNTINFKPIYYWVDEHGQTVPTDAGIVILHDCTEIIIQDLNLTDTLWQGIVIGYSSKTTVTNCYIESTGYLTNNCIQLYNSTDCMIDQNYLNGFIGIQLQFSSNNTIYGNTLTGGGNQGSITFTSSEDNVFYHNNFTNNYNDVLPDQTSSNQWDNGYPDGGNYWDNYVERMGSNARDNYNGPYQNQTGADGIWDMPYPLNDNNTDRYPIVPEYSTILLFVALTSTAAITAIAFRRKARAPRTSCKQS